MFRVIGYKITFKHYDGDAGEKITECNVLNAENEEEIVSTGYAWCCPEDQFNRNTGRKIAMARAIKDFIIPVRANIWDAYFEARGGKW
jgi:hypothetical protein